MPSIMMNTAPSSQAVYVDAMCGSYPPAQTNVLEVPPFLLRPYNVFFVPRPENSMLVAAVLNPENAPINMPNANHGDCYARVKPETKASSSFYVDESAVYAFTFAVVAAGACW